MLSSYAITAMNAAEEAQLTGNPITAWQNASIKIFGKGTAQQLKGCPKNAFLGLCKEGKIKGIPKGNYTKSLKNKSYALKAVEIMKRKHHLSIPELWSVVLKELNENPYKQHNAQMDIVIALFQNNLLNI